MWGVLVFAPIIGILGFIISSMIAYNIFFYQFYKYLREVKDNDGKVARRIRKIIEIVYYITVYFIFCLIIGLVLRVWGIFF